MSQDPMGDLATNPGDASKRLTTYMMLGRIMHDQEIAAGLRKPEEPQLQLTGEGWRVWGGDIKEPVERTAAQVYEGVLLNGTEEDAQKVLDMTRERCKELRMHVLGAKGQKRKELEVYLDKLREQLNEAIQVKLKRSSQ